MSLYSKLVLNYTKQVNYGFIDLSGLFIYNVLKFQMATGLKWPIIKFDDQLDNQ